MKKILKLYLAHNFNDRAEIRKIGKNMEKIFRIELLNPFYDQERYDVTELDKIEVKKRSSEMQSWDMTRCKGLVEQDLNAIRKCNGILTILNHASFGTAMEIITCAYFYRMPVYVITKKFQHHPWLRYMIAISDGEIFETVRQFKIWLKANGYERKKKVVRE